MEILICFSFLANFPLYNTFSLALCWNSRKLRPGHCCQQRNWACCRPGVYQRQHHHRHPRQHNFHLQYHPIRNTNKIIFKMISFYLEHEFSFTTFTSTSTEVEAFFHHSDTVSEYQFFDGGFHCSTFGRTVVYGWY